MNISTQIFLLMLRQMLQWCFLTMQRHCFPANSPVNSQSLKKKKEEEERDLGLINAEFELLTFQSGNNIL